MLYLFRDIYAEAVSALPLNGGSYNVRISILFAIATSSDVTLFSSFIFAVNSELGVA